MKEYLFSIRNEKDAKDRLSSADHLAFVKRCEDYISELTAQHKMISASPLVREGVVLSKTDSGWKSDDIRSMKTLQVGYYHIRARDLEEAIEIAKRNPEFDCVPSATIEVRELKTVEQETGFSYPHQETKDL